MTHSKPPGAKLPDGVPADNKTRAQYSPSGEGDYEAPQMAVPNFAEEKPHAISPASVSREGAKFASTFEDDDRAGPGAMPPQVQKLSMFVAVAAVLAALAVIAMAMSGDKLPLCSTQPDWNQYNCRAG